MSDPVSFPSTTPFAGLPLLVPGQAQKEFFLNAALGILDALQPRAVKASQAAPPASPAEGDCFRVTAPASGAWAAHADAVAVRIGGDWHFIAPAKGMALFDQAADHLIVFRDGWKLAASPGLPGSGSVVDLEARAAITALVQSLQDIGVLAGGS